MSILNKNLKSVVFTVRQKKQTWRKYQEAKGKEQGTMIKARQIAESLKLNMKIGDVEIPGWNGNKATFITLLDEPG